MHTHTSTGLPGMGEVPWGTHYCHFYDSQGDLADTLVPYFKAGLDANDACLWVTSTPLDARLAREALGAAVRDLSDRERRGQIEIIDHHDWYLRTGQTDAASTLSGWIERERLALSQGYQGLRLTGNTYWLERRDWTSFVEYERLVNATFRKHRILGLCSYCFDRCASRDVLDVVENHQFTVVRRGGSFAVVEAAGIELAREDLIRVHNAVDELRAADRRKDQFIAMLGHELRNPLAPIVTAVDLMRMRGADAHRRELDIIERQTRHLTVLVDDLLDMSRIARGEMKLRREPQVLDEILASAVEAVQPLVSTASHELVPPATCGLVVDGDRERLVQIFTNLLRNAAKYTPPGGRITVDVASRNGYAWVRVEDNGPGIPQKLLPHVFEPFVQGERASDRREGGLGLGLPIVKSLVEQHGGRIAISSRERGTQCWVALPLGATCIN